VKPPSNEIYMPRRDIAFDFVGEADSDWFQGSAFCSAYCDALSSIFPVGERFFISSVQSQLPMIKDPALRAQIRDFSMQEAMHTREHEAYNAMLHGLGYDTASLEARISVVLDNVRHPASRLATTLAIEHITATLAHVVIANPKMFGRCPAAYRDFWTWHAIEEIEHKGVAYDVFLDFASFMRPWKRYLLRCIAMIRATWILHGVVLANLLHILKSRGLPVNYGLVFPGFWYGIGSPGIYRKGLPYFLRFFIPGFHPWKCGSNRGLKCWENYFDRLAEKRGKT
jgi:predicted metal-dependent hydrolase